MPSRRRHSYAGGSSPATTSSNYSNTTFTDRSFPTPARTPTDKPSSIARRISGIFISCFTPPDPGIDHSKSSSDNNIRSRRSSTASVQRNYGNATETEFTFDEIYDATKNFSPSFRIGQGGFGTVYKVKLRDGKTFAVKRAKKSMHDDRQGAEFMSEIQTLAQVTHLSLVKYYGYVVHDDEKILIVEYVANGTLRDHLDCKEGKALDMATRLDIATDVAHAITYLHMYTQPPIIHRDIKSSNILLTENFRAKVADFGFARLAPDSESGATHISTQVKGTAGRRPIELSRGQKERITIRWAIKKFTSGDTISVLDPKLEQNPANSLALEKVLEMAFQCLAPHRRSRPSMKKCSEILWGIRKDYRELLNTSL
ncbi:unnamed protein product [Arabidopsis arenosa]|uniref:Protein kinase domain-containing protein n=1 Tax=Arabidopsis arenosa TaxID=38785 RepID=A0A8S2AN59_ARAAE|nr:unnamed protein product [Arabidopsis arenosa]